MCRMALRRICLVIAETLRRGSAMWVENEMRMVRWTMMPMTVVFPRTICDHFSIIKNTANKSKDNKYSEHSIIYKNFSEIGKIC